MYDYEVTLTVEAATPDPRGVEAAMLSALQAAGIKVVAESIYAIALKESATMLEP